MDRGTGCAEPRASAAYVPVLRMTASSSDVARTRRTGLLLWLGAGLAFDTRGWERWGRATALEVLGTDDGEAWPDLPLLETAEADLRALAVLGPVLGGLYR